MRLIDVDALLSKHCLALKGPNNGEYDSCSECLGEPHGYCGMEMKGDKIYDAPTIYAIPVEWMMKVLAEANEFPISEHETIVAIPYLIKRWQKEQEASST